MDIPRADSFMAIAQAINAGWTAQCNSPADNSQSQRIETTHEESAAL